MLGKLMRFHVIQIEEYKENVKKRKEICKRRNN